MSQNRKVFRKWMNESQYDLAATSFEEALFSAWQASRAQDGGEMPARKDFEKEEFHGEFPEKEESLIRRDGSEPVAEVVSVYMGTDIIENRMLPVGTKLCICQPSAVVPDDDLLLQDAANKICKHLPEGLEIRLCMENGAAWVELSDYRGDGRTLPEIDDMCLVAQLNSALCVACGWTEQEQES